MTKLLKINLKKLVKPMASFLIKKKNKTMIILVMLRLKAVVVDKVEALVVLEGQIFQIFLKIFLEILVEEEDQEIEAPITEVRI